MFSTNFTQTIGKRDPGENPSNNPFDYLDDKDFKQPPKPSQATQKKTA